MPKSSLNVSLKAADDIFSTEESRQEEKWEQVQQIPLAELFPFKNHPFKVLDDESIDFRAAARSVLLIGRVKREPNVRVIIHDKSSLAPEGKPMAFSLGAESGFSWIGEYDITADELLSGTGGNTETKTEQAERLILDLLADGKEMASEDIVKAAAEAGISERTVQNAKRSMGGILGARRVGSQWYNFIKKKQPPETAK